MTLAPFRSDKPSLERTFCCYVEGEGANHVFNLKTLPSPREDTTLASGAYRSTRFSENFAANRTRCLKKVENDVHVQIVDTVCRELLKIYKQTHKIG